MKRYFVLYDNQTKSFGGNIFKVMYRIWRLDNYDFVVVTRIGCEEGL